MAAETELVISGDALFMDYATLGRIPYYETVPEAGCASTGRDPIEYMKGINARDMTNIHVVRVNKKDIERRAA